MAFVRLLDNVFECAQSIEAIRIKTRSRMLYCYCAVKCPKVAMCARLASHLKYTLCDVLLRSLPLILFPVCVYFSFSLHHSFILFICLMIKIVCICWQSIKALVDGSFSDCCWWLMVLFWLFHSFRWACFLTVVSCCQMISMEIGRHRSAIFFYHSKIMKT